MNRAPHDPNRDIEAEAAGERWLSIEAACQLLGVDQSTLRRWSDSGKIPVFRTPGGHRRYNEDDLRAWLRGESRPRRRMSRQVLTNLSYSVYESAYLSEARTRGWYTAYSPAEVDELRTMGRRLVDLAIRTITGRADRPQILAEGRRVGRRYGDISSAAGLSVTDAVDAFLFFRYPVLQAVTQFIEEENLPARRSGRTFTEISHFLDQVLVATVDAHSAARTEPSVVPDDDAQRTNNDQ